MYTRRVYFSILFLLILLLVSCESAKQDALHRVQACARNINENVLTLKKTLLSFNQKTAHVFSQRAGYVPQSPLPTYFKFFEDTAFYKAIDDGNGGIWASGFKPITQDEILTIQFIDENLMSELKRIGQKSPLIGLTYILTTDHVGFFYPYFDAVSMLEMKADFYEAYMPFYQVSARNNSKRGIRWIEPYIDAAGNGYICSLSSPVYIGDDFVAATAFDIPLQGVGAAFLDQDKAQAIFNHDSLPMYMTPLFSQYVGIQGLGEHYYFEHVKVDEYASEDFKLKNHQRAEVQQLAEHIQSRAPFDITLLGKHLHGVSAPIPEAGWTVVELVP